MVDNILFAAMLIEEISCANWIVFHSVGAVKGCASSLQMKVAQNQNNF